MLCLEGKVSLQCFLGSFIIYFLISIFNIYFNLLNVPINCLIILLYWINIYFLLKFSYDPYAFKIAIRAAFLGFIFALGIYIRLVGASNNLIFGTYMCIMAFFHYSEFLAIAIIQPKEITTDTFVLNHSPQYIIAAVTSWIEFFIESYFYPNLKEFYLISNLGLCISIMGELLRKSAMLTAGSNFNHLVQSEKAKGHVLVTNGVYAWFRHPSYVGWFYWSIGTQLILVNPFCTVAYSIAAWLFFKGRIYIEEITLLNFFGQQYCDYQKLVGTGIPFIEGYTM